MVSKAYFKEQLPYLIIDVDDHDVGTISNSLLGRGLLKNSIFHIYKKQIMSNNLFTIYENFFIIFRKLIH